MSLFALPNRYPVAAATLAAIVVLGSAYGFEFAGYPPCELCWWQRYPYMVAIVLGLVALAVRKAADKRLMWMFALCFAATAGIGGFHVGVEESWWQGPATCSGTPNLAGSLEDALAALQAAPVIRCTEAAWRLFGISMAGYNLIVGFVLMVWCISVARKKD